MEVVKLKGTLHNIFELYCCLEFIKEWIWMGFNVMFERLVSP